MSARAANSAPKNATFASRGDRGVNRTWRRFEKTGLRRTRRRRFSAGQLQQPKQPRILVPQPRQLIRHLPRNHAPKVSSAHSDHRKLRQLPLEAAALRTVARESMWPTRDPLPVRAVMELRAVIDIENVNNTAALVDPVMR